MTQFPALQTLPRSNARSPFVRVGFARPWATAAAPSDDRQVIRGDLTQFREDQGGTIVWFDHWDVVQSFSFEFGTAGGGFDARFVLYDRNGTELLAIISAVFVQAVPVNVHFEFGWTTATGEVNSGRYVGVIQTRTPPSFDFDAAGGCSIAFSVAAFGQDALMQINPRESRSWPEGTRPDAIIRDLFAIMNREAPQLPGNQQVVFRLDDPPVPLAPIKNNGSPLVFPGGGRVSVIQWINSVLFAGNRVVAAAKEYEQQDFAFYRVPSADGEATYRLVPRLWSSGESNMRLFVVGRDPTGKVRRFAPSSALQAAAILGSAGSLSSPIDRKATDAVAGDGRTGTVPSFARDLETLVLNRKARWATAQMVGLQASIEMLGEPNLMLSEPIMVHMYVGGGTSVTSPETNVPELFRPMSGVYIITGVSHHITGGDFTTACSVAKVREIDPPALAKIENSEVDPGTRAYA